VLDTSEFTVHSIKEVVRTFFEAVVLVCWSCSSSAVAAGDRDSDPGGTVSIIGTFAAMHLLGFSINMLTMFGMILAIGLVVGRRIVVVENVEANITKKISPLEAAKQAMTEIAAR